MKNSFTITLFPEHMQDIESAKAFTLPEKRDFLFFSFEMQPNLEVGDGFNLRIMVDKNSTITAKGEVVDIVPPLIQEATEERWNAHAGVLAKYMHAKVLERLRSEYFKGEAARTGWMVYFKKVTEAKESSPKG